MPPLITHKTFRQIHVHTAKCEVCQQHNRHIMYRCTDCVYQFCTPCWNRTDGLGNHIKDFSTNLVPTVLPVMEKQTKPVKKNALRPHPWVQPLRQRTDASDDDVDSDADAKMAVELAKVGKAKKCHINVDSEFIPGLTNGASAEESPDDDLAAADTLLEFSGSPRSRLSSTSSADENGLSHLLNAAAAVEKQPAIFGDLPPRTPTPTRTDKSRSNGAFRFGLDGNQSLSPPASKKEFFDDVEYDSRSSFSFTSINARDVKKNGSDKVFQGSFQDTNAAIGCMKRKAEPAKKEKGNKKIDECFSQSKGMRLDGGDANATKGAGTTNAKAPFTQSKKKAKLMGNDSGAGAKGQKMPDLAGAYDDGNVLDDSELEILEARSVNKKKKAKSFQDRESVLPSIEVDHQAINHLSRVLVGGSPPPAPNNNSGKCLRWPIHVSRG